MSQNITVAVRVRPLSQKEVDRGAFPCLEVADGKEINCIDPDDKQVESLGGHKVTDYLRLDKHKDRSYAFDSAIGPEVDQKKTFNNTLDVLIPDVLSGRNACCFAYGATGSGKTFTMTGSGDSPGLIPQSVEALFAQAGTSCAITMQYVEIYNEQIKDLLQPANVNLDVREAPGKGTFVAGAANVEVTSRDDVEMLLEAGNTFRTTESTQLNVVSSRSHAVLQLRCTLGERRGKLSLIDLAGSERASKTGVMSSTQDLGRGGTENNTKRLNEGANINRSLLALANCISALADQARKGGGSANTSHVPYRDSKLTRLLKDSLGGACRTMMIANVSPSSDQFDETLNTLKYADRAKRIKTKKSSPGAKQQAARRVQLVAPDRPADMQVAAARRAAARSAAAQLDGAKAANVRHLARMEAGRTSNISNRDGRGGRPGLTREVSKEEYAAQTMQRHARGRLTRKMTLKMNAGDVLAAHQNDPRRKQALAKRAALAQAAGDVPAAHQAPGGRVRRFSSHKDISESTTDAAAGGGLKAVRSQRSIPQPPRRTQLQQPKGMIPQPPRQLRAAPSASASPALSRTDPAGKSPPAVSAGGERSTPAKSPPRPPPERLGKPTPPKQLQPVSPPRVA